MIIHELASSKAKTRFATLEQDWGEKHNFKFNYSQVVYLKSSVHVIIICNDCDAVFKQTPASHSAGHGCKQCQINNNAKNNTFTKDMFLENLLNKYPNILSKYDFTDSVYVNACSDMSVKCLYCYNTFSVTPTNMLASGGGCGLCRSLRSRLTTEQFLMNLFENFPQNKELYDYTNTVYVSNNDNIEVRCVRCDTKFTQLADVHRRGSGCSKCNHAFSPLNFYQNKPTHLYYVKVGDYYKIGVCKNTVNQRYSGVNLKNNLKLEVIKDVVFDNGIDAYNIEQNVLRKVNYGLVSKDESPIKGGWTEVRSVDFISELEDCIDKYKERLCI